MEEIPITKIIRTRRRTITLQVTPDAALVVRAPRRTPVEDIEDLVREKSAWILRKMDEMKKKPAPPVRHYRNGERFLFLGQIYVLQIVNAGVAGGKVVCLRDRLYVQNGSGPDIKMALESWYIVQAVKIIRARCTGFCMIMGKAPVNVHITDARQRWGSCNTRGTLNFSWRLIFAPQDIIDYVIVHELVHLEQPDHSKAFWKKVRGVIPDYEQRKQWLNENERLLTLE